MVKRLLVRVFVISESGLRRLALSHPTLLILGNCRSYSQLVRPSRKRIQHMSKLVKIDYAYRVSQRVSVIDLLST